MKACPPPLREAPAPPGCRRAPVGEAAWARSQRLRLREHSGHGAALTSDGSSVRKPALFRPLCVGPVRAAGASGHAGHSPALRTSVRSVCLKHRGASQRHIRHATGLQEGLSEVPESRGVGSCTFRSVHTELRRRDWKLTKSNVLLPGTVWTCPLPLLV